MTRSLLVLIVAFIALQPILAQKYGESKGQSYILPEVLLAQNGSKIKTAKEWERVRRPEVLKLFEDNIYGQVPKDFDKIKFELKKEDTTAMVGKATLKEVAITVSRNQKSLTINLIMFIPNKVQKSAPVFLVINHRGVRTMDVTRNNKMDFWPAEEVIDAGYAIAGFDVKDVAPDNKTMFVKGVLELYPEQLMMNNGMGALSAWVWGASRVIDYFETDPLVNKKKIIVVGHSRGGKASLWCGAQDERVAIAISNDSGNSGASITRRKFGETIKDIVHTFPYWFCKNYSQYIDNEDKLPVDQHMLLALMAPRGVYVGNAADDLWADPEGQYLSLVYAQPVYGLYGFETDLPAEMPSVNERVFRSHMGFHNREGKHNMINYDWQQFIAFANNFFTKSSN